MKLLSLFLVLMTSSFAFAAETVRVVEDVIPHSIQYTYADAKFYMDTESSLGYAQVEVNERYQVTRWVEHCYPVGDPRFPSVSCRRVPHVEEVNRLIYKHTELIPNLVLEGNKMVYHSESGAVECGTLGTSRVFRRPTLYLSGKCQLDAGVVLDRADRKVIVDFKVK
ncbi:MAG TPA: hypothetical protein VKZ84_00875 [Bacteriovoracaceae bacterium]|nr:hypothetical protein [Bacteriovoracaceae bacterium]